jgi:hypothetical protein
VSQAIADERWVTTSKKKKGKMVSKKKDNGYKLATNWLGANSCPEI